MVREERKHRGQDHSFDIFVYGHASRMAAVPLHDKFEFPQHSKPDSTLRGRRRALGFLLKRDVEFRLLSLESRHASQFAKM